MEPGMNTITATEGARLSQALPANDTPPVAQWWIAGIAVLLPLLAYFGTAASIVSIWERSETFAHGFVIVPITLWLVWRCRAQLALLPVRPCWPALAALLLCGAAWMLAMLGDVLVVRQYAFALMIPLTVLAVFGTAIARALIFPLAFLLFGVPVGEGLIDPLIGVTANFTVDALRMTGIPVLREGNNFSIPSGNWSVVEACSGLRYLISSVTLGCLYAYLTYQSTWRRLLFVIVALALPVLANGLRAYMIVMIGHSSNMTLAVGVDHLIYGWAFFGLVMLLLFWVGSFWREDAPTASTAPIGPPASRALSAPSARVAAAVLGVAACVGVWPAYGWYIERGNASPPAVDLASFAAKVPAAPAFHRVAARFRTAKRRIAAFLPGRQPGSGVLAAILSRRRWRKADQLHQQADGAAQRVERNRCGDTHGNHRRAAARDAGNHVDGAWWPLCCLAVVCHRQPSDNQQLCRKIVADETKIPDWQR
jgi:exosortase A